jgi:hypothetical protein
MSITVSYIKGNKYENRGPAKRQQTMSTSFRSKIEEGDILILSPTPQKIIQWHHHLMFLNLRFFII